MRRLLCTILGGSLLVGGGLARNALAEVAVPLGLPADTQSLLRRLPETAGLVVTLDAGDDNPSMAFAKVKAPEGADSNGGFAAMEKAQGDIREGMNRILRVFGLDAKVFDRLSESMGPRFVLAAVQGSVKNGPPDLLILAKVSDRSKAEASLSTLIGSLARNAVETTEPLGSGQMHTWTGFAFMNQLKLSYLIGDDVAAIGTNLALLQHAAAAGGAAPAWLTALAQTTPRGVVNAYVSPQLPAMFGASKTDIDPAQMGFLGATAAVTFHEDGILLTESAILGKDGMLSSAISGASNLPGVSDAAFQRIPANSLAVVAVSSPAAWLKAFGGAGLLAPMIGGPNGQAAMMINMFTTLFDGDTTMALRSALPLPSVVAMVAGADPASASAKVATLLNLVKQMKLQTAEVTIGGGGHATVIRAGSSPLQTALAAQQGNFAMLSTDRRTLDEIAGLSTGDSLAESESFRAVRSHIGDKPNVVVYADLSPLSGLGMIAAQSFYRGMPIGQEVARLFSKVHGMGMGVEIAPDRITSRTFLSGEPATAFPAMIGATAGIAGALISYRIVSLEQRPPVMRISPPKIARPKPSKLRHAPPPVPAHRKSRPNARKTLAKTG